MNQYYDNKLPIIIVITQNYNDKETEIMTDYIKNEFKFLNREITIMPVVAEKKIMERKKNKFVIEKDGIEELIKISFEKSQRAIYPAIMNSVIEKIIQTFMILTENKKIKLKDELKEILQKISDELTENEYIENSITKLSLIFEKNFDIFFEIPLISEQSKKDINDFLENLSKWCIERLKDVILNFVKENSKELWLLLFNEQTKVKKEKNVERTLSNEKTIEEYTLQSKQVLQPLITNKVYFLALKIINNIIFKQIVEMNEEVMKEQIKKIEPELKNIVSDEKLKQLSNKILQDIIENK